MQTAETLVLDDDDYTPTYEDVLTEQLNDQEARIDAAIFLSSAAAKKAAMQVVWEWEPTSDRDDDDG